MLKNAAYQFVKAANRANEYFIVQFQARTEISVLFTTDADCLLGFISGIEARFFSAPVGSPFSTGTHLDTFNRVLSDHGRSEMYPRNLRLAPCSRRSTTRIFSGLISSWNFQRLVLPDSSIATKTEYFLVSISIEIVFHGGRVTRPTLQLSRAFIQSRLHFRYLFLIRGFRLALHGD
jgi:hypothetical protein